MSKNPFKDDGFQHYYLRTQDGQPYGVVAVAPGDEEGTVHRGISLCSTMDAWNRVLGRRKAVGRVKKAMITHECSDSVANVNSAVVRTFAREHSEMFLTDGLTIYKSGCNVRATKKELAIIANMRRKTEVSA